MEKKTTVYVYSVRKAECYPEMFFREYFPERLARAARFRFPEDRLRCFSVGILLFEVLGIRETDLRTGENGKLFCDRIPERFSISHSGDYAVLSVSPSENGVDLEKIDPKKVMVTERFFLPEELEWLREKETEERFFELWTMKESVSKALGLGLSLPFDSFSALPLVFGKSVEIKGKKFYGECLRKNGYVLSVCTEGEKEEVRVVEI